MLNAAGMGGKMVSSCAENPAVGVFTQPRSNLPFGTPAFGARVNGR
jgi:hypothetical protein